MTIRNTYKFLLTHPLIGAGIEVFPHNNSLSWLYESEGDQIFYRKKLNTDLVFVNDSQNNIDDFTKLFQIDRSNQRCEPIELEVLKKCGETFSPYYNGTISLIESKFDVSKCKVICKTRIVDRYTCLLNDYDREVDIYDGPGPGLRNTITIAGSSAIYEELECCGTVTLGPPVFNDPGSLPEEFIVSCNPTPPGFVWYRNEFFLVSQIGNDYTYNICSFFRREIGTGTCSGGTPIPPGGASGWVLIENNCPTSSTWYREPQFTTIVETPIENALRLRDVITWLAGSFDPQEQFGLGFCGIPVMSNFFNINPDGDYPSNYAYQKALDHCQFIAISHIEDIRRPSQQGSFIWNIKFSELLEDLRILFNVYWDIDDNGTMRIEHISYFRRKKMMDLTKTANYKYIDGLYSYEYKDFEIPKIETFKFPVDPVSVDFSGQPIRYQNPCSNDGEFKEIEFGTKILFTDVLAIRFTPNDYPSAGYVLISTDNFTTSKYDTGKISGASVYNGALSWANLMDYFHQYNRPHYSGLMNNEVKQFKSVRRVRQQTDIKIPLCCEDTLSFNPDMQIKTQMGWGELESAEIIDPGNMLTIKLNHVP